MTVNYMMDLMQGSDDWHRARTGILTSSQVKKIITPSTLKTVKGVTDGKSEFLLEIVAQRALNYVEPEFQSWDMQRGQVEEVYAKDLYCKHHAQTKDCGFVTNDRWGFTIGFSPDALVGEDGFIECKSRCQKYQTQTIIENEMPSEYMMQVQTGLLVTERKWCDFISYSNGMPMFVKRILPDERIQAAIEETAHEFEMKARELLKKYEQNAKGLIQAPRRDPEDGTEIKPSHREEERNPADYLMAG